MKDQDSKSFLYVQVALPVSTFMTFTYKIPSSFQEDQIIGRRVLVPFKNTKMTGIVVDISTNTDLKNVKQIEAVPDKEPVFNEVYIDLIKKISEYYISPVGITAYYALPDGLRWRYDKKKEKWIKGVSEENVYIPQISSLSGISNLSQKAYLLLQFILQQGEVTKRQIKEEGFSQSQINTLLKKGYIKEEKFIFREEHEIRQIEKPYSGTNLEKGIYIYNTQTCEKRLTKYIQIALGNIKKGRSTLFIFPNIETIKKLYPRLKKIFGDKLFIYFDSIPEREKIKNWFTLKKLKGTVTLGTHPSLFIPIKDLSTIIIEEEYSEGYKNHRTPRYDARRVAFELYRLKNDLSLIYGASAVSTESYYMLLTKKAKKIENGNILETKNPQVFLKSFSPDKILDRDIIDLLKNSNKNFLIVVNKKGYSSFLYCLRCEEEIKCKRCDLPLKVHKADKKSFLQCDHCEKKYEYINECPECENPLKEIGYGIEKVERLIKEKVGNITENIKILPSLSGKGFLEKNYDIVININPDFFLYIPDFRGEEIFFRSILLPFMKAKKKYIILTNQTENNTEIKAITQKNLEVFYKKEIENRKKMKLPPFSRFILLTFEKKNLEIDTVRKILNEWVQKENIKDISYEGPYSAFLQYAREKNRVQVILKNFKHKEKIINLHKNAEKKGIKLIIDVDPKRIY
ncbi:hypothetical protein [Persephonella sp.]|uniref:primosomal protein N' family DNA-binding protein n=1 Tax=Persephonella sp. TaxID=2060922 RepID=UPI0025F92045|nr:hypothetical protein [Persephonella sp.]